MDDDEMLLTLVREGDDEAYGLLWLRHRAVATRVAARWVAAGDADDVVADSFAAVLRLVRTGAGPARSFRAYLLTTVRHEASRRRTVARRCEPTADLDPVAPATRDLAEAEHVRDAYGSLPPRWRHVLWRLEVEGVPPRDLADELGLSPNAVSALGCRARAGLRAAYLGRPDAA